jgi:hypothetical protein
MATVLCFPKASRGHPDARKMVLARKGFRWRPQQAVWRKGVVVLSDFVIEHMTEPMFQALLNHLDRQGCPCCHRRWDIEFSAERGDDGQ